MRRTGIWGRKVRQGAGCAQLWRHLREVSMGFTALNLFIVDGLQRLFCAIGLPATRFNVAILNRSKEAINSLDQRTSTDGHGASSRVRPLRSCHSTRQTGQFTCRRVRASRGVQLLVGGRPNPPPYPARPTERGWLMSWAVVNAGVEPKSNAIIITKQASGSAKIDPLMAAFNAIALMSTNPWSHQASIFVI